MGLASSFMKRTHGMSRTKLFSIWSAMHERCGNPNCKAYKNYGGRGITVCSRWFDFSNFNKDMGGGWKEGLTIERKNNNGNYEPNNCQWVTRLEQANNRRNTRRWVHDGVLKTSTQISAGSEIRASVVRQRLHHGWPVDLAITLPVGTFCGIRKKRDNSEIGNKGHRHGMSKIHEADVLRMREMSKNGITNVDIAKEFNMTPSNVGRIVKRKGWTHI